ncbi:MAG: multiheme c-type cytochrome [Bradymonadia bacterium]
MALLLSACTEHRPAPSTLDTPDAALTVETARAFYAAQPRYLHPVDPGGTPKPLADLRAATCGQCHVDIYNEWKTSTHAHAWLDDAQFQEELKKSTQPSNDVGWMCVNCHTPLLEQRPQLVVALKDGALNQPIYVENPTYDEALQLEAITCATCHVRDGVIVGPYGDTPAPHPVKKGEVLTTSQLCMKCHQAVARFDALNLLCAFNTGHELAESPQGKAGQTCQHCHMPEITRPITALGTPPRKGRRHFFGGSLIPKHPKFAAELAPVAQHHPPGLEARWHHRPVTVSAGEQVTLTVDLINARSAHLLPTGDPERFLKVDLSAHDATGQILGSNTLKIGATYRWHPRAEKIADNRLKPGEGHPLTLSFTAPKSGPVQITLTGAHWRISQENFDYHHLEGRSVSHRVFLEESWSIDLAR